MALNNPLEDQLELVKKALMECQKHFHSEGAYPRTVALADEALKAIDHVSLRVSDMQAQLNRGVGGFAHESHVWLVYRPAAPYEESDTPYFVCLTEQEARACADKMIRFLGRLSKRFPSADYPGNMTTQEWKAYCNRLWSIFNKAKWPFGIDLRSYLYEDVPSYIVQVKPLRLIELRRHL